ncbi:hypothetical protein DY000_02054094 [Brassica cretica]|uniref:Uncharacterized protein n=1 Tax=Brassica cretica TaxID=69181 RepID=A0ABQ7AAY5_BRACR|nr:hypothetical protein DY000_02054094 [Brassica cretica]
MLLVGREVSESRMSLVEGRVHHTVDPCADPVPGSQKLGGPSVSDYEKLHAEKSELQIKYNDLLAKQPGTFTEFGIFYLWSLLQLDTVKSLHSRNSSVDDVNRDAVEDKHTGTCG